MKSYSRRNALKTIGIAAALTQIPFSLPATTLLAAFNGKTFPSTGILIGAGKRGCALAAFLQHLPERRLRLVGVAEQQAVRRHAFAQRHYIADAQHFEQWEQMLQQERFAQVVIITACGDYSKPCIAALKAGYDVWLDKHVSLDVSVEAAIITLAKNLGRQLQYFYMNDGQLYLNAMERPNQYKLLTE